MMKFDDLSNVSKHVQLASVVNNRLKGKHMIGKIKFETREMLCNANVFNSSYASFVPYTPHPLAFWFIASSLHFYHFPSVYKSFHFHLNNCIS